MIGDRCGILSVSRTPAAMQRSVDDGVWVMSSVRKAQGSVPTVVLSITCGERNAGAFCSAKGERYRTTSSYTYGDAVGAGRRRKEDKRRSGCVATTSHVKDGCTPIVLISLTANRNATTASTTGNKAFLRCQRELLLLAE